MGHKHDSLLWVGLASASLLLAVEPIKWLVTSWQDPSYQSNGALYCLLLVGLVAFSLCSSPTSGPSRQGRIFVLFLIAASLRLLGQMLAINILSALALSADVYAVATFLGLDRRKFALSPFWLAVFFLFALPLGPILQRVAGYPSANVREDLTSGATVYASTGDDIWLESRLRTSSLKTEKAQIRYSPHGAPMTEMRNEAAIRGPTPMTAIYWVLFFFNSLKAAVLRPTRNALP